MKTDRAITVQNSDCLAEKVGQRIGDVLNLPRNAAGFFETNFGPRSWIGLARLVDDIIKAEEED
jgi:hypothetical protein